MIYDEQECQTPRVVLENVAGVKELRGQPRLAGAAVRGGSYWRLQKAEKVIISNQTRAIGFPVWSGLASRSEALCGRGKPDRQDAGKPPC